MIAIVLIWTMQMPQWLASVSPTAYLTLIALNLVISLNLEVVPRNERKLLEELKRVAGHHESSGNTAVFS